jgi:hypothetical protein
MPNAPRAANRGTTRIADEALERMHTVANAPINSIFQHQLGLGIVGGRLYSGELVGEKAAERAVQILLGGPATNFAPEVVDPLLPRHDWRELVRWKIDQKRLPPGSTILFHTPSMWQQDRGLTIGIVAVVAMPSALVAGLLVNRATRPGEERALAESTELMGLAADAANLGMWVWDVTSQRPRADRDADPARVSGLRGVVTGKMSKEIVADLGTALKTVKVRRGRVMEKMGMGSVAELVWLAKKAGAAPPSGS